MRAEEEQAEEEEEMEKKEGMEGKEEGGRFDVSPTLRRPTE